MFLLCHTLQHIQRFIDIKCIANVPVVFSRREVPQTTTSAKVVDIKSIPDVPLVCSDRMAAGTTTQALFGSAAPVKDSIYEIDVKVRQQSTLKFSRLYQRVPSLLLESVQN